MDGLKNEISVFTVRVSIDGISNYIIGNGIPINSYEFFMLGQKVCEGEMIHVLAYASK